jgi:hypothetical protein
MTQMDENRLFAQSRHNRLLLSLHSLKKRKTDANFLDANLIWVAPECQDTGELACLYRGTFGLKAYF